MAPRPADSAGGAKTRQKSARSYVVRIGSVGARCGCLMRRRLSVLLSVVLLAAAIAPARPLVIYFIDVEGGQSTLVVTPRGQTLLIDAGFPGPGTFQSAPGDPRVARDPQRILAAA